MDDTREEMRKLIDVIEKGSKSASIEQAVEDIKTFANTASYLANALDTRLKQNAAKPKANKRSAKATQVPKPPMPAIPKPSQGPKPQDSSTGMPLQSAQLSRKRIMTASSRKPHRRLWAGVNRPIDAINCV